MIASIGRQGVEAWKPAFNQLIGSQEMNEIAVGDVWGVVLVFTVAVTLMALCALTTTKWK